MLKKWHIKTRQRGRIVVPEARNTISPRQRLGFNGGYYNIIQVGCVAPTAQRIQLIDHTISFFKPQAMPGANRMVCLRHTLDDTS